MPYDSTIQEVKDVIKQEELESEQEIIEHKILNPVQIQPFATYNRTAAAEYAVKWHDGRNSLYKKHSADCTNFVSQAVFAGGKEMKKPSTRPSGITSDTNNWYSERYSLPAYNYGWRETSSWVNVEDFKTFWAKTQSVVTSSSKNTIIANANVGDVIQLQASSGSRFYHSLIVHKKADGTLYLAAHSIDRVNLSIKDISAYNLRVIKF
ncbi:amidase domain-containing protein [Metalysinibacillus jejuensis]|uniref:amidase domain-containing protein n=1 Tax=Metalysinibacillus jejuensis TaxID=914327 RepID=UPI000D36267C|nr:amidase domain-containing protein [Metalysinibacillus jejuensis]